MNGLNLINLTGVISVVCACVASAGETIVAEPDAMKTIEETDSARIAGIYYDYFSEVDYDDEEGGYSMDMFRLHTPIMGDGEGDFVWAVDVNLEYLDFDNRNQPLLRDYDLYRVGLELNFMWQNVNGSKWSPAIKLNPSIAGDFRTVTTENLRLTAFAGAFYQQSPNLKWLVGVYYTDNLHDELLIPIAGFSWQPCEHFDITALGPRIDFTYIPNDRWHLGVFASGHSRSWDVEEAGERQQLEVNSMRAGVRFDYRIAGDMWLALETGATLFNAVELLDDDDRKIFDDDAEEGFFAKVGLRYQF